VASLADDSGRGNVGGNFVGIADGHGVPGRRQGPRHGAPVGTDLALQRDNGQIAKAPCLDIVWEGPPGGWISQALPRPPRRTLSWIALDGHVLDLGATDRMLEA